MIHKIFIMWLAFSFLSADEIIFKSFDDYNNMDAGHHIVSWNATHHASGIYFVQMNAGTYMKTQKLMLVK